MDNNANSIRISNFRFWCQKVLPAVYDDSLSYYELLCKVVDKLNEIIDTYNATPDAIAELQNAVNELRVQFNLFKESGFDDYYAAKVESWIRDNVAWIFTTVAKQVWFGLTLNGYFVAYVPDSWADVWFDTGMSYGTEQYGRLILTYYVNNEGQYVVEQP